MTAAPTTGELPPKLLSFDGDGVQHAWDATSVSAHDKCPRYYQLSVLEGWSPIEKSVHLLFGGWYATALEHYFKHVAAGKSSDEALVAVVRETLISTWEYETDDGENIPDTGKPWESFHNTKTRETLIRTIVWYFDHFQEDPCETFHLPDGKPAVELSIALPVDDDIIFCGHLDRLVTYSQDLYVMDQKTTGGSISPHFFSGFLPGVQMPMYTYLGQIVFNLPVKGVIIDAAAIAVGFTNYGRGFVNIPKQILNEWYDNTMATITRARVHTREKWFPMNTASCGNYGGCEFRKVCSRIPEHRQSILNADFYRGKRWDPLERR